MTTPGGLQTFDAACLRFVNWLDGRILAAGRGDETDDLDVDPGSTFWLGRLASEEEVKQNPIGDRAERLDPCAIGIRLRPAGSPPWTVTAVASLRAWIKEPNDEARDPARPWRRLERITVPVTLTLSPGQSETAGGKTEIAAELSHCGAGGLSAEVRIQVEDWHPQPEVVVELVNTSPEKDELLKDTHLYEVSLEVNGLATEPFILESLPDSFRYDRKIPAYGINVGIEAVPDRPGAFRTVDAVSVDTLRPSYWNSPLPEPDLSFERLGEEPIGPLEDLLEALAAYNDVHWSSDALNDREDGERWDSAMRRRADDAAEAVAAEMSRLRRGVQLLRDDSVLKRAFCLMNRAIMHSARHRGYARWRPFQVGFMLQSMSFLADPGHESDVVDTVWFATGGGKTETYLGLLVTAALYDRLTGKTTGVTAWSRFPLRMLSLQQTQRFADALAGAELVRRTEKIGGAPLSLGFYVGGTGGTPNRIPVEAGDTDPDPEDLAMPGRYQVLTACPFCGHPELRMSFDRRLWCLCHECPNDDCPWPYRALPFYVVDDEIYRFLPTVIVGTLDKAASIGMQAAMRGLIGPPLGMCSQSGHGYCYAPRKSFPHGCLVPGCPGSRIPLPMAAERYPPSLRLQDELHLLRDSLGAVDSHYESLLDHLQNELGAPRAKIAASSATLTGYDRQVDVLYQRTGRVFPQPGPKAGESFWSRPTSSVLRRFVAVAPRGVTLEFVSDRTANILQESIRQLLDPMTRQHVLDAAGIAPGHAEQLVSVYGTDVIYGSTLYDVEAAQRSLDSNASVAINSEQLTGQTAFDDVRAILDRLENPEPNFSDRIHVIAASSMLSHGVDVSRLNVMTMLGLPLTTAEFIQTTSRIGRNRPGLVHVLLKIGRERDAEAFRHFDSFIRQGDRFIEPIPITRRSRRVLALTMPGIVEARRLMLMEPRSPGQRLTTIDKLRAFMTGTGTTPRRGGSEHRNDAWVHRADRRAAARGNPAMASYLVCQPRGSGQQRQVAQ